MKYFESILPLGMDAADFALLLVALAAVVSVVAVWNVLLVRDPMAARLRSLGDRREALKAGIMTPTRRRESRRVQGISFMREIVQRLKLLKWQRSAALTQKLATAGWRSRDAVVVFLFFKAATPVLLATVAALVLFGTSLYQMPQMAKMLAIGVAGLIGFMGPDILVKNMAQKRQQALRKAMPDTLDLMVICAEAGLSIDATFSRVAREMALTAPVMADEMGLTSIELGFLPDRSKALHNLNARTDMTEIRGMVNTLLQTEKFGTPLAQALRVLSAEFRNERLLRAEEKAARLPAVLTVPMIIFILPCLFIVLLGPAALRTIDALSGLN